MKYTALSTITLSLVFIIVGCNSKSQEKQSNNSYITPKSTPRIVSYEIIEPSDFAIQILSNGIIHAKSNIAILTNKQGVISNIHCRNGQLVKKGTLLAVLTNQDERFGVKNANIILKQAELELNSLILGFGGVSGDTTSISSKLLQILKIQSGYSSAKLKHQMAVKDLENTFIYSPITGYVADLKYQKHETIKAYEPLCRVINNNTMYADYSILETELSSIKVGNKVKIIPLAFDTIYITGNIISINPIVDKNGIIKIRAVFSNPYYGKKNQLRLIEGMNVSIITEKYIENAFSVPKKAIVLRSGKEVIFSYKHGRASWNYVQTGFENSSRKIVKNGLAEGDTIITTGNINLAHDSYVQLKGI